MKYPLALTPSEKQATTVQHHVATAADTCQNVALMVPTVSGEQFKIPLVSALTCRKKETIDKPNVQLVKISFCQEPYAKNVSHLPLKIDSLRYASLCDSDRQRMREGKKPLLNQHCQQQALRLGWLYLFKEGKLWREFEVKAQAYLSEVDLSKNSKNDDRLATGVASQSIVVPVKIENNAIDYQVAFSEIQWSWPRVRFYQSHSNKRQQRMDKLALSDYFSQARSADDNIIIKKRSIIVLVKDPLALIRRVQMDLSQCWQQLLQQLMIIGKKPYFDSAITAYHLFYSDKVQHPDKPVSNKIPFGTFTTGPMLLEIMKTPLPEITAIRNAEKYLDKTKIESTLNVDERKTIRKNIRSLQALLVKLLRHASSKHDNVTFTPSPHLDGVDFTTAYSDYFAASIKNYVLAFAHLQSFLAVVMTDPAAIDGNLDLKNDANDDALGVMYLLSLLEPTHPLNSLLIPSDDIINIYQPGSDTSPARCIPNDENDGSGVFRMQTFQCLYQASLKRAPFVYVKSLNNNDLVRGEYDDDSQEYDVITQKAPTLLNEVFDALLNTLRKGSRSFMRHMRGAADMSTAANPVTTSIKLVRATGLFNNLYLAKPNDKDYIPGIDDIQQQSEHPALSPVTDDAIPIYEPGSQQVKGVARLNENPGFKLKKLGHNTRDYLREKLSMRWLVVLSIKENKAVNVNEKNTFISHETLHRWLGHGQKSVSGLLATLAVINLEQAVAAFVDDENRGIIRKDIEAMNALSACLVSLRDFSELILSPNKVEQTLSSNRISSLLLLRQFPVFGMLSSIMEHAVIFFSFLGLFFAMADLSKEYFHGDWGEMSGDLMSVVGSTVVLASQAGKAVVAQLDVAAASVEEDLMTTAVTEIAFADVSLLEAGLFFCAPWSWVGIVLMIAGNIIAAILNDTDLQKWAKHGPFAKDKAFQFIDEYQYWAQPGMEHYAYQSLMSIISSPGFERTSEQEDSIVLEVGLQRFTPGRDWIDLRAWWEVGHATPLDYRPKALETLTLLNPYKIIQVKSKETLPRVIKMLYYFHKPNKIIKNKNDLIFVSRINAKLRLIMDGGKCILPASLLPSEKDNDLHSSNNWVHLAN